MRKPVRGMHEDGRADGALEAWQARRRCENSGTVHPERLCCDLVVGSQSRDLLIMTPLLGCRHSFGLFIAFDSLVYTCRDVGRRQRS